MSLFVEVFSVEKNTKVIVNLDTVIEIAPLLPDAIKGIPKGGCMLFFPDATVVGGKFGFVVTNKYSEFRQFVLETVTEDMIAKKISSIKKEYPVEDHVLPGAKSTVTTQVKQEVKQAPKSNNAKPKTGTTTADLG